MSTDCFIGFCGTSEAHCRAPDAQIDYGSGADALKTPHGSSTEGTPRPALGDLPYGGGGIYRCKTPNTIALTFDDGPNKFTKDVLDILDSFSVKATFFITGINSGKGAIDDDKKPWKGLIERMFHSGHQIASHTWSHQDMSTITRSQRRDQMIRNEMAFRNVIDCFPTYMRPPYSSCSVESGCVQDMGELGYHITYYDIDTSDYMNDSPEAIHKSKAVFDNAMSNRNPRDQPFLVIGHDVHQQTVYNLTAHMLRRISADGYRAVTLGECLGDPKENWYRSARVHSSAPEMPINTPDKGSPDKGTPNKGIPIKNNPPLPGGKVATVDGSCGPNYSCLGSDFGPCCSRNGFCGATELHCGDGCQPAAGTCHSGNGILRGFWRRR